MRGLRLFWAATCAPALTMTLIVGCGDKPASTAPPAKGGGAMSGPSTTGDKTTSAGEKTPVEAKDTATIKGKVVYDGTPPTPKSLKEQMSEAKGDKELCLSGDTNDPLWMVGADKGVANVVVWVKAPEGKYLKTPDKLQARTEKVKIDQPHCAFEPHVVAFSPTFFDAASKKEKKTGEVLEVLNSSPAKHNTGWNGNRLFNSGASEIINPKGTYTIDAVAGKPDNAGGEDLLSISCDIHKWMTAKAAVFDHPFYAVTNAKGEFEIKDVPAGSELILCVWHESMDPTSLKKATQEKVTLEGGKTLTKEIKLK